MMYNKSEMATVSSGGSFVVTKESNSLLSGLLRCGKCGSGVTTKTVRSNEKSYYYYTCVKSHKEGKSQCSQPSIKTRKLEEVIIKSLHQRISNKLNSNCECGSNMDLEQVEKRIEDIQSETLNLIKHKEYLSNDQFILANDKLKNDLNELLTIRNSIQARNNPDLVKNVCNMMRRLIEVEDPLLLPEDELRLYLETFIDKVELQDKICIINYKFI